MIFSHHVRASLLAGFVALGGVVAASAEPVSFDFKDPKGVNGIVFVMDSKLEPIVGTVGGVEGQVSFDPANPESFTGKISVDLATTSLINSVMVDVLKGKDWLNLSGAFLATMSFDKVTASAVGDDGAANLTVEGTMSLGDQKLPLTVDIAVTHLPDMAAQRGPKGVDQDTDLLVLRSRFTVSRLDLGIKPDAPAMVVGETIAVTVPIVGYSK